MAFTHSLGRRRIAFSHHALDRWWERCEGNAIHGRNAALDLLRQKLDTARWSRSLPCWSRVSRWNQAIAEGFVYIDDDEGFIVNRSPETGDLLAVTFIDRIDRQAA